MTRSDRLDEPSRRDIVQRLIDEGRAGEEITRQRLAMRSATHALSAGLRGEVTLPVSGARMPTRHPHARSPR